jgi:hypothetical protein
MEPLVVGYCCHGIAFYDAAASAFPCLATIVPFPQSGAAKTAILIGTAYRAFEHAGFAFVVGHGIAFPIYPAPCPL